MSLGAEAIAASAVIRKGGMINNQLSHRINATFMGVVDSDSSGECASAPRWGIKSDIKLKPHFVINSMRTGVWQIMAVLITKQENLMIYDL